MSLSLRTTILATGCFLAIGTSVARAQMPRVFYYPAPGNYATTQGTVNIPAAGYYYNVPLYAVPAPVNPAPAQGFTYSPLLSPILLLLLLSPRWGFHGGRRRPRV